MVTSNSNSDDPTYKQAINGPDANLWKDAINKEIEGLERLKTWNIVDRPKDQRAVGSRFVLRRKRDAQGNISKYKARLVAQCFTQTFGLDYTETFSPVVRLNTVLVLLSLAATKDWEIHQMDVDTAYLNATLEEEIYLEPPNELNLPRSKVLRLNKALYGLKQSGRAWYKLLSSTLGNLGWNCCPYDHCMYSKKFKGSRSKS